MTPALRERRTAMYWAVSLGGLALVTALLLAIRDWLALTHIALAYLLVVLGTASRGGRLPGATMAVLAFLCFNFFFIPPYHTLTVASPVDWAVLGAFLAASLIAAQLLVHARARAAEAEARAREVERLSALSTEAEVLRKSDEFKNAMLASVSHDLRTPLTTIKALANEIRQDGDDRAVVIEEEADRLNRFVADLLDLSRIASGSITVTPEICAAEDLVGAALQRVGGAVGNRELVASLDVHEPLLLGRFDFVHSLRVLSNLIENALKFAPAGSTVEVRARRAGDRLEFIVLDRGSGVPEPDRDVIFDAFRRGTRPVPDAGGAGLGLSIARSLARAQGGDVRYEPRPEGGSAFVFSVPAADLGELERTSPPL